MQIHERGFTDQEFDIMIEQLTVQKPASFDMLCKIADNTLRRWVIVKCRDNVDLCKRHLEEDIFHDILIRLMKKTVTGFLLNGKHTGQVNRDPDGFSKWMFSVAGNIINDAAKKARKEKFMCQDFSDGQEDILEDSKNEIENGTLFSSDEHNELLSIAVSVVLDSESQPYIVLTWIAMCIFMINTDISKIDSNHKIVDTFFDMSLRDMYDMVKTASKKIPWLVITQDQAKKMEKKLNRIRIGTKTYGETPYREFFMKKKPLSTISDWENRMNSLVKREKKYEASNCK